MRREQPFAVTEGGIDVFTAILFDPRLWLYLAVLVVFAVSSLIALLSALATLIVVEASVGTYTAYQTLRRHLTLGSARLREGVLISFEELIRPEFDDPATALQPGVPDMLQAARDPHQQRMSAPNEADAIEGTPELQPRSMNGNPLKPLNRPGKRRNKPR